MFLLIVLSHSFLKNEKTDIKRNDMTKLEQLEKNSRNTEIFTCEDDLTFYLDYSYVEINCSEYKSLKLLYNDIIKYTFIVDDKIILNIANADMDILNENIENIANSVQFNSKKNVAFSGIKFDNYLNNLTTYAKLFHEDDIELWVWTEKECNWCKESNITAYWESKIKDTNWRKIYMSGLSYLHYSIDDDYNKGKITIISKKTFIIIIVLVTVIILLIIISLFIISNYCSRKKKVSNM